MKVKITVMGQSGHCVRHEGDAADESDLSHEIAVALVNFSTQCRESVFNCTINVDHAVEPAEAILAE